MTVSCENCSQSGVEIEEIQHEIPTVFGNIDIEIGVCKTCKSAFEYCIFAYSDLFERLTVQMSKRAMQLRNKTKRGMK